MVEPIVIDANVFKGFYMEEVLGSSNTDLTDSTLPIISSLGVRYQLILDTGNKIQTEWLMVVHNDEWLTEWLAKKLINGQASVVPVSAKQGQGSLKKLHSMGFPKSRDVWYIRTAAASQTYCNAKSATLLSEDLDFYAPKRKSQLSGKSRREFLKKGRGPVAESLRRDKIYVVSCCNCPCS